MVLILCLDELDTSVAGMVESVKAILTEKKKIHKIDHCIDQLEVLNNDGYDGADISTILLDIENIVTSISEQKHKAITKLLSKLEVDQAEEELYILEMIFKLKHFAPANADSMFSLFK